jgi:hypothetical protein
LQGLKKDNNENLNTIAIGLQMVNSLTKQIDGDVEMDGTNRTYFKIIFKN